MQQLPPNGIRNLYMYEQTTVFTSLCSTGSLWVDGVIAVFIDFLLSLF